MVNHSDVQGGWTGTGSNNLNTDPRFVDPDGADSMLGTPDDNPRLQPAPSCTVAGDNPATLPALIATDLDGHTPSSNSPGERGAVGSYVA